MSLSLYVLVETLDGTWERLGTDRNPDGYVEAINPTYNAGGPDSLTFTINRPRAPQPDLLPFTPVELWSPRFSRPLWSGFTVQAPGAGTGRTVNVSCQGWQWYLDEVQAPMTWIHTRQGDWAAQDAAIESKPVWMASAIQGATESDGSIRIIWPANQTVVASTYGGLVLDLGEGNGADRAVMEVEDSGNAATTLWYLISSQAPFWYYGDGSSLALRTFNGIALNFGGAILRNGTALDRRMRYWHLIMGNPAGGSPGADLWIRVKRVIIGQNAYIAASPGSVQADPTWSRLNADDVFKDVRSVMLPLLSSDEGRITPVSFNIPHFHFPEITPARAMLQKAADYHGYNWGVDADKRLFFEAQPSTPALYVDAQAAGVDFQDQSSNDASELWNHVRVTGKDGAGYPLLGQFHAADFIGGYRDVTLGIRGTPVASSLAAANPSFTTDIIGWSNIGTVTLTRDTTAGNFTTAPAGLSANKTVATAFQGVEGAMAAGTFKLGTRYVLTVSLRATVATSFQLNFGAVAAGDYAVRDPVSVTTGFVDYQIDWIPRSDISTGVVVRIYSTAAATSQFYVDDVRITEAPLSSVAHANPSADPVSSVIPNNTQFALATGWRGHNSFALAIGTSLTDTPPNSFTITGSSFDYLAWTDAFVGTFKAGTPYRLGIAYGFRVTSGETLFGWTLRWRLDFGILAGATYQPGNRYSTYTEDYVAAPAAVGTVTSVMNNNSASNIPRRVTWVPDRDYPASQVQARFSMLLISPRDLHTFNLGVVDTLTLEEGINTTATDRRNRNRSFRLEVGPPTTMPTMRALAQQFLLGHRTVPLRGSLSVSSDAATDAAGNVVPREALGRYHGKMVRVLGVTDPDSGANNRDATITNISGTDPVNLTLDNTPRGFDALLARVGAVSGLD